MSIRVEPWEELLFHLNKTRDRELLAPLADAFRDAGKDGLADGVQAIITAKLWPKLVNHDNLLDPCTGLHRVSWAWYRLQPILNANTTLAEGFSLYWKVWIEWEPWRTKNTTLEVWYYYCHLSDAIVDLAEHLGSPHGKNPPMYLPYMEGRLTVPIPGTDDFGHELTFPEGHLCLVRSCHDRGDTPDDRRYTIQFCKLDESGWSNYTYDGAWDGLLNLDDSILWQSSHSAIHGRAVPANNNDS